MNLSKKISLVTGGAQGIGKAIANLLSNEGSTVLIVDIDIKKAKSVVKNIKSKGGNALAFGIDVSSVFQVDELFHLIVKKFGKLDILINNAGIAPKQKFEDISLDDWERVLKVNLTGVFLFTKKAFLIMKEKKYGKIVNISSIAGQNGGILASAHYVASKAGMIGFTKYMAKISAPYNINVNTIAPGRIATRRYYMYSEEFNRKINEKIPLGHPGSPEDVAEAVLFLVSDKSKYITGACLNVNGGIL